jgi:hypothetical protein
MSSKKDQLKNITFKKPLSKKEQLSFIRFKKGGATQKKEEKQMTPGMISTLIDRGKKDPTAPGGASYAIKYYGYKSGLLQKLKKKTGIADLQNRVKIKLGLKKKAEAKKKAAAPSKKEQLKNVTVIPQQRPAISMPAWILPAAAVGAGLYFLRK